MNKFLGDLKETLETLKKAGVKLNPTKYTFGVSHAKFLGHVVFYKGFKANHEKVNILANMKSPQNLIEVQMWTR